MCAKLLTVPFKTEIRVKESTKLLFKGKIPFPFASGHQRGGSNVMIQNNGCQRLPSISHVSSHIFTWGLAQAGHLNCSQRLDKARAQ